MDCLVPFLLDPIKCLKLTNYSVCSYVSHKESHVTQFCYVFIGPRSSSLTTDSLRMSASAHETLVQSEIKYVGVSTRDTSSIITSTIFHILTLPLKLVIGNSPTTK